MRKQVFPIAKLKLLMLKGDYLLRISGTTPVIPHQSNKKSNERIR
jgi:hypothetical protein